MDNLVLTQVAAELSDRLPATRLDELRQESADRFRLLFAGPVGARPLVVSVRPERPWIGAPSRRWDGPRWVADPFAAGLGKALVGRAVASVARETADRVLRLRFGDGEELVVELRTHGANLVHLDAEGRVRAALRHPRSAAERLATGARYAPRGLPAGQLDPSDATPAAIDAFVLRFVDEGEEALEVLRRRIFGVGSEGARLVGEESERRGASLGTVLRERLDAVRRGDARAAIDAPVPPWDAVASGRFARIPVRLLPWGGASSSDATEIAGLYYECADAAARLDGRRGDLGGILRAEIRRAAEAEARSRAAAGSFENPDAVGRRAEALLAGLTQAARDGERVVVPDPYDAAGGRIAIDAPPGIPLTRVAEDLFKKQRRARRGIEAAAARAEALRARVERLDALLARHAVAESAEEIARVEEAMRAERLPVGLGRGSRASRAAEAAGPAKLVGVRMIVSADGATILVGRTGKDNDRLTFKIAAPDDLWLHAHDVPGAHVVVRRPAGGGAVSESTLREAARLAAWFSDARSAGAVDVAWTARKNVRRARGGGSGRVVLKRFQLVRVAPTPPAAED